MMAVTGEESFQKIFGRPKADEKKWLPKQDRVGCKCKGQSCLSTSQTSNQGFLSKRMSWWLWRGLEQSRCKYSRPKPVLKFVFSKQTAFSTAMVKQCLRGQAHLGSQSVLLAFYMELDSKQLLKIWKENVCHEKEKQR